MRRVLESVFQSKPLRRIFGCDLADDVKGGDRPSALDPHCFWAATCSTAGTSWPHGHGHGRDRALRAAGRGWSAGRRSDQVTLNQPGARHPARAQAAAFPRQGQAGSAHLLHRRGQPSRYLGLQARALEAARPADARGREADHLPGGERQPGPEPLEIQAAGADRQVSSPTCCPTWPNAPTNCASSTR